MKKFSERQRELFRLSPKDFNGEDIYLDHIDDINGIQVSEIINKYKDDSISYNFELIKLLCHGNDFEIDLTLEKDYDKIKEIISNPDQVLTKIMLEIYKMIIENTNTTYEMTEPLSKVNPNLLKKVNTHLKETFKQDKKIEEMNEDELRKYIKMNNIK